MINAIYIMWLREIKRFWRSKARIFGSLGQPLLFLVALGFGLGHIFEAAGQGSYIQFLAPGIVVMTVLFGSIFNGISVIWDRQFGFLKETLVAPVSRSSILIGRCLGGTTIATLQGILILIISLFIGFKITNWCFFPIAILFILLISFLCNLFGTIIASKLEDMQAFQLIMNFVVMPLFFLSGALFPLEEIANFLKIIVSLNPISYGIDGLRWALTGSSSFNLGVDFTVLIILNIFLIIIGQYFFERIES